MTYLSQQVQHQGYWKVHHHYLFVKLFTDLNNLHRGLLNPNVRVKVFAVTRKTFWKTPANLLSLEVVLIDQQGHKIIASINRSLIPMFEGILVEGHFFDISGFNVLPYEDRYKLLDHLWKIQFLLHTNLQPCPPFNLPNDEYLPFNYPDILSSVLDPTLAFDVVGQLVELRRLRVAIVNGHPMQFIRFTLQDLAGHRITVSFSSTNAVQLYDYATTHGDDVVPIIFLLNNCFIKEWEGGPVVTNHVWGTRLFINEHIDSIVDYTAVLQNLGGEGFVDGVNEQNGGVVFLED
ncbi:uncharacterized protein [Rutidosis leptorrhynchoides]|uniref:uncharacterized protein n=1 Tax=Rutidosis leptorrhynchoides TaxID=125765 RepID=UPI003A99C6F4